MEFEDLNKWDLFVEIAKKKFSIQSVVSSFEISIQFYLLFTLMKIFEFMLLNKQENRLMKEQRNELFGTVA